MDEAAFAQILKSNTELFIGDLDGFFVVTGTFIINLLSGPVPHVLAPPAPPRAHSSIDLHMVGAASEAVERIDKLGQHVATRYPVGFRVERTETEVIIYYVLHGEMPPIRVILRIVLRVHESVHAVLCLRAKEVGDLAAVWDGQRLSTTPQCLGSIERREVRFDPSLTSDEYANLISDCTYLKIVLPDYTGDICIGEVDFTFHGGICVVSLVNKRCRCVHCTVFGTVLATLGLEGCRSAVVLDRWPSAGIESLQPEANADFYISMCEMSEVLSVAGVRERFFAPFMSPDTPFADWLAPGPDYDARLRAAIAVRLVALEPAMRFALQLH